MSEAIREKEDFRSIARVGSNANFAGLDFGVVLRRYALMRRMWKLDSEELTWVTAIFLRKTNAGKLYSLLNDNHEWKDRVEFQNKLYDLEFIDMSITTLEDMKEENPKEELLISIRENNIMDFYVFIVKKKDGRDRGYIKELV